MLRRANTGWRDGSWTVPAGHVEKKEGPIAAAVRELYEETGLIVTPNQLSEPLVYFYPEDSHENERVSLFFELNEYNGQPINAEPSKADAAEWFDIDHLPKEMPPLLLRSLTDLKNGVRYSERYYNDEFHQELLQ